MKILIFKLLLFVLSIGFSIGLIDDTICKIINIIKNNQPVPKDGILTFWMVMLTILSWSAFYFINIFNI